MAVCLILSELSPVKEIQRQKKKKSLGQCGSVWSTILCTGRPRVQFPVGTYPGCGFNPWSGHIWEATDWCISHRYSLALLSKNQFIKKAKKKHYRVFYVHRVSKADFFFFNHQTNIPSLTLFKGIYLGHAVMH